MRRVTSVVFAGLGGQGVIKASDILADAACRAGHDVKKAEIHGMSQRGGSVSSDVRFGAEVLSPMVPRGGSVRQKPDIAAADGVSTAVPGFSSFYGTSAAAPQAAAIGSPGSHPAHRSCLRAHALRSSLHSSVK